MPQRLSLVDRRRFLQTLSLAASQNLSLGARISLAAESTLRPRRSFAAADLRGSEFFVPVRPITQGPSAHWFGYYDKLQFDVSNRFVLGMEVDFEDRGPNPHDTVKLGMVDLQDSDRWIRFGETSAWCWQQGCMLQWLPGSESKVIYNTRRSPHGPVNRGLEHRSVRSNRVQGSRGGSSALAGTSDGEQYGATIQDVRTGEQQELPSPIYTVSADGKTALAVNFARLGVLRPGYGYEGVADPFHDQLITDQDGIHRIDLDSGESELVISLAHMLEVEPHASMAKSLNWFNHLLFNPTGDRFIFLHRWKPDRTSRWQTRMLTANADGTNIHVVADTQMVSHFIWKDANHILAWAREPEIGDRFFLYTDQSDEKAIIGDGVLKVDGHCTYSPDGKWICTDSYPGKDNLHRLTLYHPADGVRIELGRFFQPGAVRGKPNRCDLHPGWSRDGKQLCIDSMMNGSRQLYLVDVSEIVDRH